MFTLLRKNMALLTERVSTLHNSYKHSAPSEQRLPRYRVVGFATSKHLNSSVNSVTLSGF
jgi:hypothetical protein